MLPFFQYLLECVGMSEMTELLKPSNKANLLAYIENQIREANKAYEAGKPIMSDMEYDTLESALRKMDHKNPLLRQVGVGISAGSKVKHRVPMGSLNKAQSYEDMLKWYKTLGNCGLLIVSDKLDGISIDLRYENGEFVQAVTRGDGVFGEDITRNVSEMSGVVLNIDGTFTGSIRGEIVIRKHDFAKYFPGELSTRNSAAGAAKRLDTSKARHCTVLCYRLLPRSGHLGSKHEEFGVLNDLCFQTPEWNTFVNVKEVEKYYHYYIDSERDKLPYEIDGLVIEVDDNYKALEIGTNSLHPEYAIAYKFPHATAETKLERILWQVGKTGRVTPVGMFEPVNLVGALVRKASLATSTFVTDMDLGEGDIVLVSRRNDVIPKIERVIKKSNGTRFGIPYACPDCGWELEREGEYIICPNIGNCKAQIEGGALNWLKKIGVLEWGDAIMADLNNDNLLSNIADLYKLSERQLAEIVGDKRAKTMIDTLHAKMSLPLHVFVGSLGIKGIGRTNAKSIMDYGYDTLHRMQQASQREIANVPGMGPIRAQDFVAGLSNRWSLIKDLQNLGIKIIGPKAGSLTGKSFCMTGFRDAELAEAIENAGGVVKSSVGQGLTYLVQKDANSRSEKTKKALAYGTLIIDQNSAWKMAG